MPRESSPLAGKTVKLKPQTAEKLGGEDYRVEDWWISAAGESWQTSAAIAAFAYAMRIGSAAHQLPLDDEVLYGKVGNFGHLVHVSEVEA